MKKIIALILAAITTVNGTSSGVINEANIHEYVASDCESVAEFIIDNLEFFADEYNKEVQDEALKFEATSCEKMIPVYVVSTDQEGLYVDFNDNNGYMITCIMRTHDIILVKYLSLFVLKVHLFSLLHHQLTFESHCYIFFHHLQKLSCLSLVFLLHPKHLF